MRNRFFDLINDIGRLSYEEIVKEFSPLIKSENLNKEFANYPNLKILSLIFTRFEAKLKLSKTLKNYELKKSLEEIDNIFHNLKNLLNAINQFYNKKVEQLTIASIDDNIEKIILAFNYKASFINELVINNIKMLLTSALINLREQTNNDTALYIIDYLINVDPHKIPEKKFDELLEENEHTDPLNALKKNYRNYVELIKNLKLHCFKDIFKNVGHLEDLIPFSERVDNAARNINQPVTFSIGQMERYNRLKPSLELMREIKLDLLKLYDLVTGYYEYSDIKIFLNGCNLTLSLNNFVDEIKTVAIEILKNVKPEIPSKSEVNYFKTTSKKLIKWVPRTFFNHEHLNINLEKFYEKFVSNTLLNLIASLKSNWKALQNIGQKYAIIDDNLFQKFSNERNNLINTYLKKSSDIITWLNNPDFTNHLSSYSFNINLKNFIDELGFKSLNIWIGIDRVLTQLYKKISFERIPYNHKYKFNSNLDTKLILNEEFDKHDFEDFNALENSRKYSALSFAIKYSNNTFLEQVINPNNFKKLFNSFQNSNRFNQNFFHIAAEFNNHEFINFLLKFLKVNKLKQFITKCLKWQNSIGYRAIDYAAKYNNEECLTQLMHFSSVNEINGKGLTYFHYVCEKNTVSYVKNFISKYRINLNEIFQGSVKKCDIGTWCIKNNLYDVALVIIENPRFDFFGNARQLLESSIDKGNVFLVKNIINRYPSVIKFAFFSDVEFLQNYNLKYKEKHNLLNYVITSQKSPEESRKPMLNFLLNSPAINLKSLEYRNIFTVAIGYYCDKTNESNSIVPSKDHIVALLENNQVELNFHNKSINPPVINILNTFLNCKRSQAHANLNDISSILKLFVARKDDINWNLKDIHYASTALMLALKSELIPLAKVIFEYSKDSICYKDKHGHNALYYAEKYCNQSVLCLLIKNKTNELSGSSLLI